MKQGFMDYLQRLKEETIASLHDIEEAWETAEEEFNLEDESTEEPRKYCGDVAASLDETIDILVWFNPSVFRIKNNSSEGGLILK